MSDALAWESRSFTHGRVEMQLHTTGENAELPLIGLVHGLENRWNCWDALAALLAPHARLLAFDMPWSGQFGYMYNLEVSPTELFAAALAACPEQPTIWLAHSMGANVVLDYISKHDVALQGLVLVSPFYKPSFKDFGPDFVQEYGGGFIEMYADGLRMQTKGRQIAETRIQEMATRVHLHTCPLGFMAFMKLFSETPALALPKFAFPVGLIGGTRDRMSKPSDIAALASALPHGDARVEDGCGHFVLIERPEAVLSLVEALEGEQGKVYRHG